MKPEPFLLERFFADKEFGALFNLCGSDCESMRVADLLALEGNTGSLAGLTLGYTQPAGAPGLRAAIADLYRGLESSDVLVHSAGEEAIFTFMNAALSPGDHVIVHGPSYQSLHEIPRAIGCDVSRWEATAEEDWTLDLNFLRDSLRRNTRALVVNVPHSPTGYLMDSGEWEELVEIVRTAGLILFSDEAYRGLEYDPAQRLPAACEVYERACSLGLLSKGHGLPGLRIAWLATRDSDLYAAIARMKDYTTICASAPSELLAEIAVRHEEMLLSRARNRIRRNLGLLDAFFDRHEDRFRWVPPRAGPVTFPELRSSEPVEEFCARVLDRSGVLLLPGTAFTRPTRAFRMGFGREGMPEALERFEKFVTA